MKKIAINVVIIPPDPVLDLTIEWNRKLRNIQPANIALGKHRYLPHISMVMGCIRLDQLTQVATRLDSLAEKHDVLELYMSHIQIVNTASGNKIISFDIDRTQALSTLHESIVKNFRPLLTQDADESSINDSPPISPEAIDWINHYIPDQCFDNFWPHITVGFGDPPYEFQPLSFQGTRLAICHLGNHCTCSEILAESPLNIEQGTPNDEVTPT